MKFQKTIDLRNPFNYTDLKNGILRLQVGQWVKLGSARNSRFVGIRKGIIYATHPTGSITPKECKINMKRFIGMAEDWAAEKKAELV